MNGVPPVDACNPDPSGLMPRETFDSYLWSIDVGKHRASMLERRAADRVTAEFWAHQVRELDRLRGQAERRGKP